jgi:hypothetical protein
MNLRGRTVAHKGRKNPKKHASAVSHRQLAIDSAQMGVNGVGGNAELDGGGGLTPSDEQFAYDLGFAIGQLEGFGDARPIAQRDGRERHIGRFRRVCSNIPTWFQHGTPNVDSGPGEMSGQPTL